MTCEMPACVLCPIVLHCRARRFGDFISAGGVTGTVEAAGLFVTTIDTPDNLRTFVGNNKLFAVKEAAAAKRA
jgi:small-conductance mechanosensitive channel